MNACNWSRLISCSETTMCYFRSTILQIFYIAQKKIRLVVLLLTATIICPSLGIILLYIYYIILLFRAVCKILILEKYKFVHATCYKAADNNLSSDPKG